MLHACSALIKSLDVRRVIHDMIDGAFFGYRVAEIMWEFRDGLHWPRLDAKPCEWFVSG
jgi:phage gp29-like protein